MTAIERDDVRSEEGLRGLVHPACERAVFVRAEGVLWRAPRVGLDAYLAANAAGLGERALRLFGVALASPVSFAMGGADPTTAVRARVLALRGMQRDRVEMLTEEYLAGGLAPRPNPAGFDLLEASMRAGYRGVVVSSSLFAVVEWALRGYGVRQVLDARQGFEPSGRVAADTVWVLANHLRYTEGGLPKATGAMHEPVIGGWDTTWRTVAERAGVRLERSRAYGALGADLGMLTAVGEPCAVNPDASLRQAARGADWPVVYTDD